MNIRQLFDQASGTYTYLLWDARTADAVIIDPVLEQAERDIELIRELGLNLRFSLETHVHADHVTGGGRLREAFGCRIGVHENAGAACADLGLHDGQTLLFGKESLRVIYTPGHTDTDVSFYGDGRVFTGDALLIRGTGRTDFQSGDPGKAYDSIMRRLYTLPGETLVFPAHDYRGRTVTTIDEERRLNPRIRMETTREAYQEIMSTLDLPKPARIDVALPGNLSCGLGQPSTIGVPHG